MPTLNPGPELSAAVGSLVEQKFEAWELLIVDGGSDDGALERLPSDPRIRIIETQEAGIYEAMNLGIGEARGEWVYFMGADDRFHRPDVLGHVADELSSGLDVVYGDVLSSRFDGRYGGPFDTRRIMLNNICHQSIFLRRSLFERTGPFDTRYRAQADWDHNMKWVLDPEVRRRWIDLVVADFADGGISSTQGDPAFRNEQRFQYLLHGKGQIPFLLLTRVASREFGKNLLRGKPGRALATARLWWRGLWR